jgi:hypothetical protein
MQQVYLKAFGQSNLIIRENKRRFAFIALIDWLAVCRPRSSFKSHAPFYRHAGENHPAEGVCHTPLQKFLDSGSR